MRFDKLTQAIAAGGVWRLGMAANDLQIVSSRAPLSIALYKGGALIGSGDNVLAGDYFRGVDFDLVELASAEAQEVTVLLSDGTSGSNRVVGEVSVINGEIARVKSGVSFYAYVGTSATAAKYTNLQLWNPPASGKRLVITKLRATSSIAQLIRFGWNTTQLATPIVSSAPSPKFLGSGAVSVVTGMYSEKTDALLTMTQFGMVDVPATGMASFDFDEPFVVSPGQGLIVGAYSVEAQMTMTTEYFEEPV